MVNRLTDEDIAELTKPSPWRDWIASGDPRPYEDFYIDWLKKYDRTTRNN